MSTKLQKNYINSVHILMKTHPHPRDGAIQITDKIRLFLLLRCSNL